MRPLPQVLKEHIMDSICASSIWRWHSYNNSWLDIDGLRMQSVAGGGMIISTKDHAHFGYLFLWKGRWKDNQLISESLIDEATTSSDIKPIYGYMWWLIGRRPTQAEYNAKNYNKATPDNRRGASARESPQHPTLRGAEEATGSRWILSMILCSSHFG